MPNDWRSAWAECRPPRSEAHRADIARAASAHLPAVDASLSLHITDEDIDALKAAFMRRFNEDLPRTETLFAVAMIGYRMALRDFKEGKKEADGGGLRQWVD